MSHQRVYDGADLTATIFGSALDDGDECDRGGWWFGGVVRCHRRRRRRAATVKLCANSETPPSWSGCRRRAVGGLRTPLAVLSPTLPTTDVLRSRGDRCRSIWVVARKATNALERQAIIITAHFTLSLYRDTTPIEGKYMPTIYLGNIIHFRVVFTSIWRYIGFWWFCTCWAWRVPINVSLNTCRKI